MLVSFQNFDGEIQELEAPEWLAQTPTVADILESVDQTGDPVFLDFIRSQEEFDDMICYLSPEYDVDTLIRNLEVKNRLGVDTNITRIQYVKERSSNGVVSSPTTQRIIRLLGESLDRRIDDLPGFIQESIVLELAQNDPENSLVTAFFDNYIRGRFQANPWLFFPDPRMYERFTSPPGKKTRENEEVQVTRPFSYGQRMINSPIISNPIVMDRDVRRAFDLHFDEAATPFKILEYKIRPWLHILPFLSEGVREYISDDIGYLNPISIVLDRSGLDPENKYSREMRERLYGRNPKVYTENERFRSKDKKEYLIIAHKLIDLGVDINAPAVTARVVEDEDEDESGSFIDNDKIPLIYSILKGSEFQVEWLIRNGAVINCLLTRDALMRLIEMEHNGSVPNAESRYSQWRNLFGINETLSSWFVQHQSLFGQVKASQEGAFNRDLGLDLNFKSVRPVRENKVSWYNIVTNPVKMYQYFGALPKQYIDDSPFFRVFRMLIKYGFDPNERCREPESFYGELVRKNPEYYNLVEKYL